MQQLSPQDAMFAFMERSGTPLQLGWLNIYDPSTASGPVGYEDILDHVRARLHEVRFFRQKLAFVPVHLDEPYWVDDERFELEHHVRYIGLPAPGDWEQLRTLVAQLFARPLDFDRPLWEFIVIEGLDSVEGFAPGSFALLAKIHHAAIDGLSGVDVTTALHSASPDAPRPDPPAWQAEQAPSPADLLRRALVARATRPKKTVGIIARGLPAFRTMRTAIDAGDLQKPPRHKVPSTRFSGAIGPHRVIEARRFRLDELRPLRSLVPGATLNDVLLAIVGGALRRYLLGRGELPGQTLTAACPISLRPDEQRGQFGNQIANMFITLATDVEDGAERLRRIQAETTNAKGVNELIGAQTLSELNRLVPGALVSLGTRVATRVARSGAANTTVTNVPGPQEPLFLAGARLQTQFALGTLLDGMGIFHFILSYCGELTLTVTADRDKLPDPTAYAQCLQESFEELRDLADRPANPSSARRAKAKSPAAPRRKPSRSDVHAPRNR